MSMFLDRPIQVPALPSARLNILLAFAPKLIIEILRNRTPPYQPVYVISLDRKIIRLRRDTVRDEEKKAQRVFHYAKTFGKRARGGVHLIVYQVGRLNFPKAKQHANYTTHSTSPRTIYNIPACNTVPARIMQRRTKIDFISTHVYARLYLIFHCSHP